jgi:soluble cytochrome b562
MFSCGGGGESTVETTSKSVTVIDGRVDGARVFADCNNNGIYDEGEPIAISRNGTAQLTIPNTCSYKRIIAVMDNATDIDLGIKVNGALMAPANSRVVSPITTLMAVNPEAEDALKKLGVTDPQVNYVEAWNNLNATAKAFIGGIVSAINVIGTQIGGDIKIKAIEDLAGKLSAEIENVNATNSTQLAEVIVNAISNNEFITVSNATVLSEKIKDVVEEASNAESLENMAEALNDTISTAQQAIESVVAESVSDNDTIKYLLEGRFDLVRTLLEGNRDTDAKKVAYAIALLGTSVDSNFLSKIGAYIIPGNDESFEVYGFRSDEEREQVKDKAEKITSEEWRNSVKALISDIDDSLKELESISDDVEFTIPAEFVDNKVVKVDKGSIDTLKGLLLAKKALLEYLLAYDWSVYDNLPEDENYPLACLAKLKLLDSSYLSKSKEDVQKAIQYLKSASEYEGNLSFDEYNQTLVYYVSENGNQKVIANLATHTLPEILDSINDGEVSVEGPELTAETTLNLKYIFDNPIDGSKVQQDIDSGNAAEFEVCDDVYWLDEKNLVCDDYTEEIWFKEGSYLYTYIKTVYPDVKFEEREYNGEIWYTVGGSDCWNMTDDAVKLEYPKP